MVFILGHYGVLFSKSLEMFKITLRYGFRWKLMEKNFWFMASENRCSVMYLIDLFLEKLFVNYTILSTL